MVRFVIKLLNLHLENSGRAKEGKVYDEQQNSIVEKKTKESLTYILNQAFFFALQRLFR